MKKPFLGKVALVALVTLAGWLVLASAGDDPNKKPPGDPKDGKVDGPTSSRTHDDADPEPISPSYVTFKINGKEVRSAGISPQARTSNALKYKPGLRFPKPLLALVERDAPVKPGLPPVVDDIETAEDGSAWLQFRTVIGTPDYFRQCRDAVLAQERDLLKAEKLTEQDVRIEPWPLKHCVVTAQHPITGRVLGVGQSQTLTGRKEEFTFAIRFDPAELREVLGLIRAGRLEFVYSYTYVGRTEYSGKVDLKGVKNAKVVASQKLQSKQAGDPVFQAEANEAVRHVLVSVERTTRANHKDLLPLLNQPGQFDALFQKLFADDGVVNLAELKKGDEKAAEMVAAYLKPHLEQVRESFGEDKSTITIDQTEVGKEIKGSVGGGLNLGFISFGGGYDETKKEEVLRRLEQVTGSKWVKEMNTEKYRPHAITKLKFQSGADQVVIDESNTVFLSVSRENGYLEDSPVPVTFTTKTANLSDKIDLGPYQGVPIGAMLPYFGATPPKGYVWADGQANWPNAAWVPQHLRGAKVPDMREYLVGGAKDEAAVGKDFKSGRLSVPEFAVSGGNFTIPVKDARVEGGYTYAVVWENENGIEIGKNIPPDNKLPNWFQAAADGKYPGFWMRLKMVPAAYKTPAGAAAGSQTITGLKIDLGSASTNPRHVMCRWIIRVE
ncbi:MAG: hypothetical protein K2X87_27415 [Gemmataceae bacterium]|nr:hypothetical protein [Gemmataceae bacterium]